MIKYVINLGYENFNIEKKTEPSKQNEYEVDKLETPEMDQKDSDTTLIDSESQISVIYIWKEITKFLPLPFLPQTEEPVILPASSKLLFLGDYSPVTGCFYLKLLKKFLPFIIF